MAQGKTISRGASQSSGGPSVLGAGVTVRGRLTGEGDVTVYRNGRSFGPNPDTGARYGGGGDGGGGGSRRNAGFDLI